MAGDSSGVRALIDSDAAIGDPLARSFVSRLPPVFPSPRRGAVLHA
jgi:hypothetical protein